jgi:GNAT superfamily N-acetyltransferase
MFSIRLATARDLPLLPAIERAAAAQFRATDYPQLADAPLASEHIDVVCDRVWIAEVNQAPVGFVIARMHDDAVHIQEIDVHPTCARQGIGGALIRTVSQWASEQRVPCITLTTFDNVPWNAPYYARLGFVLMPPNSWSDALLAVRRAEAQSGLDMKHRVCMRLQVD